MKKWIKSISVIGLTLILCSCGVKFADVELNKQLPDDFRNRNLFKETDIFKYNLAELAGSVVFFNPADQKFERAGRLISKDYHPIVQAVKKEDGLIYNSKIDRNAALQGSYLAFASNLDINQKAEVIIEDLAHVLVPDEFVPYEKLLIESQKPKQDPNIKRYWIQGVLLATVTTTYFSEIKSNASGVVGNTFGFGGKVYNSQGNFVRDYRISVLLIDLDKYAPIAKTYLKFSSADFPFITFKDELIVKSLSIEKLLGF